MNDTPEAADKLRERLARARRAWNNYREAESQLARLAGYTHLNANMKADRRRWMTQFANARDELTKMLNGPNYRTTDTTQGEPQCRDT